ncbi:MAG: cytochrome c3 family protein [Thermodesulfobacteriota bacterium]
MRDKFVMIISFILLLTLGAYSQDEEEENPHLEMVDDQFVCLDCHTDIPKEGETSPTYFLVDLPSENCLGCHSEMEHAGVKEHEGKDAKPLPGDENGKIACFTCHDPHPQGTIKGRVVYEAHINERSRQFIELIVLPYLKQQTEKEMEYKPESEVYLREPVTENRICIMCHETLYKTDWRRYITWDEFSRPFSY